ncbi:hypothetical protein ACINNAV18_A0076 (plasmid) [Acinetobacter baumannii Naval-18]|nr:hypothetical protein [Acinetobacter baumannii]EJP48450.1 hypothetical protein ACINNAV18_A0076 [Acinetobacter baumannii Naval-18]
MALSHSDYFPKYFFFYCYCIFWLYSDEINNSILTILGTIVFIEGKDLDRFISPLNWSTVEGAYSLVQFMLANVTVLGVKFVFWGYPFCKLGINILEKQQMKVKTAH